MNDLPRDSEILAARLADERGISPEEAVVTALRETLERTQTRRPKMARLEGDALIRRLEEISEHYRALPVLDARSPDEILGYDEFGLPT